MSKKTLILKSPLSGRYYATKAYKIIDKEKGHVEITGNKDDVTDQIQDYIDRAITDYKLGS